MKNRYFLLPIIIISLIIYVIDNDNNITNKKVVMYNYNISYPIFNNKRIDNYIFNYLNSIDYIGKGNITYKLKEEDSLYYLTFYKCINDHNMISSNSNSFIIDINESKIKKYYE